MDVWFDEDESGSDSAKTVGMRRLGHSVVIQALEDASRGIPVSWAGVLPWILATDLRASDVRKALDKARAGGFDWKALREATMPPAPEGKWWVRRRKKTGTGRRTWAQNIEALNSRAGAAATTPSA